MASPEPAVISIGNFDGVHLGHAALIAAAREMADAHRGARVVAMVFHPHPATALAPERTPPELTPFERRRDLLLSAGADEVALLEPTPEFLAQSPEAFVRTLLARRQIVGVVEGPDFRFGRGRAGDADTLRELGRAHGFAVRIVEGVGAVMRDGASAPVSSTLTRWLLAQGRVRDAAACLGRPHEIRGVVTRGAQRGRELGWPTANITPDCLAPAEGVYAAIAARPDGGVHPAAVSIGTNPQFGGRTRTVEAHLIGWRGGLDDYGWRCSLRFIAWLREQAKFESVAALVDQIARDCADAAAAVGRWEGGGRGVAAAAAHSSLLGAGA